MTRMRHLAARFTGSLRARPLDAADDALIRRTLRPEELACWESLGRADRAESVATARETLAALGPDADPTWVAAALLHDVGKAQTGLGAVGRACATVAAGVAGHRRARAWRGAAGRYVNHDELGARRLREAGARPEAVAWADAHHRRERWPATGIPVAICEVLAAADGETHLR
jgi:putative nucleotidyltransferase with HDIG domain